MSRVYFGCGCAALIGICVGAANPFQRAISRHLYTRTVSALDADGGEGDGYKEVKLPSHRLELIQTVLDMFEKRVQDSGVVFYMNNLATFTHAGTTRGQRAPAIGLPLWDDLNSLECLELRVNKTLQLNDPDIASFVDSFYVSDECVQFGIARSLAYVDSYSSYSRAALQLLCAGLPYAFGLPMQNRLRKAIGPQAAKANSIHVYAIYGVLASVGALTYALLMDTYQCRLDAAVDYRVGSLGVQWQQAGLEFYKKELERNRTRARIDPKMASYFTASGNIKETWRQRSLPLTTRLKAFEKMSTLNNSTS